MTALTEFLFPAPARRSTLDIVLWWERRRLAYNVWVGSAGLVSLGVWSVLAAIVGGEFVTPYLLLPSAAFGLLANLCYLLGPATELLIHALWGRRVLPAGPTLFRMGLTFSVGLALLPTLVATLVLVGWVVATVLF